MRVYSYILVHDYGFAPNPFWGSCTLATCKPKIRKTAQKGDWIVGLSGKADGNRIIYAMQVDEVLSIADYFNDERYDKKKPDYSEGSAAIYKCGDNIYKRLSNGDYEQLKSQHTIDPNKAECHKQRDLSGINVLISKKFSYFGRSMVELPRKLQILIPGRGHKCRFSPEVIQDFCEFISHQPAGIQDRPCNWRSDNDSWKLGL